MPWCSRQTTTDSLNQKMSPGNSTRSVAMVIKVWLLRCWCLTPTPLGHDPKVIEKGRWACGSKRSVVMYALSLDLRSADCLGTVRFQVTAQDDIVVLRKAHILSSSLTVFPKSHSAMFVLLKTDHSRSKTGECWSLPFFFLFLFASGIRCGVILWPRLAQKLPLGLLTVWELLSFRLQLKMTL